MKCWPAKGKGRGVSSRCRGRWRGRVPKRGRWAACLSALAGCTWGWVSCPGGWFLSCFWTPHWFPAPSWRKWLWLIKSAKQNIFPHSLQANASKETELKWWPILPRTLMLSSLCFTCSAIILLIDIRLSVMLLLDWTRLSLVAFLSQQSGSHSLHLKKAYLITMILS